MTTATIPTVRRTITVAAPAERAFRTFTESFSTWWPAGYHIGETDYAEAVIEPHEGGRWFERGVDGSECDWGRVLVWDPPGRLVLSWQINGRWQPDPDPARASEIEVLFTAEGDGRTRVDLEHRRLERLVEGQGMHDSVSGEGGWGMLLERFAGQLTAGS
ncbi:MAG TPA: SRPBCC family protein [Pseudonocardiaceae bacterium]|nr:SRPBCC family protein [Pseudonocardiaceae bacterium]